MELLDEPVGAQVRARPAPAALAPAISRRVYWICLILIVLVGGVLRLHPWAGFQGRGVDETMYVNYVTDLGKMRLADYPEFCEHYLVQQSQSALAMLPPTRFLYLYAAYAWQAFTGASAVDALISISAWFTILSLLTTAGFAHRLGGAGLSLAVTGLMSVAMNQIHQAQHVMIDGFFTFWCLLALWSFWENLQRPGHAVWLGVYAVSLAAMVLTKENSFFVVVAICGLLVANRWLQFGTVSKPLLLMTVAGPLAGFVFLVFLTGGLDVFLAIYRLLVAKSKVVPWAILNGDGPWYRYLIDLVIVSPLVVLLAAGRAFQLRTADKASLFLLAFIGLTFALMANVKYGMNLRYATIWDMPLRFLAAAQLIQLGARFGSRAVPVTACAFVALAAMELHQYQVFCVAYPAYTLTDQELLRAVNILK